MGAFKSITTFQDRKKNLKKPNIVGKWYGKKVLVIHPDDPTTRFLEPIYAKIPDKTVIRGGKTKEEICELIRSHDRILIMGHGSEDGLLAMGQFPGSDTYIVDSSMAGLLATSSDSIFIWCNADKFVEEHGLNGFYSGMFISEVGEAYFYGLPRTSQDIVDESNRCFIEVMSRNIHLDAESIYRKIKRSSYKRLTRTNRVAYFNHNRLYCSSVNEELEDCKQGWQVWVDLYE